MAASDKGERLVTHSQGLPARAAARLENARRCVVKIGSSLVCGGPGRTIDATRLSEIAQDIVDLRAGGCRVVIVSSGAVATGRSRLGLEEPPKRLDEKQACAAAGQPALMHAWEAAFEPHGALVAQALLTLEDTERRRRWLNARDTLERLLDWAVVPVVNENDTVATDEIRYGDNDRLAARVAQLIGADVLVILSDVDGLYDADPRREPSAKRIDVVAEITPAIVAMAGGVGSNVGSGGMASKIEAARIAGEAGCATVIAPGAATRPIAQIRAGGPATWFTPKQAPDSARRQWIAGALSPRGVLVVDAGAEKALKAGKSLLPAGVVDVQGKFEKGDAVRIVSAAGSDIARGLAGYGAADAARIKGRKSDDIPAVLGFAGPAAIVHRNDMVLMTRESARDDG
jgi:glutamate 5-kinase